jgi:selenide,water dikinase
MIMLQKTTMKEGDVLILTKSLGTGLILAAAEQARAKGRWVEAAIESMLKLGFQSLALAQSHKVSACGHVGRTGLLGALAKILRESWQLDYKVAVRLDLTSVPIIFGAIDCLRLGIESRRTAKNVEMIHEQLMIKTAKTSLDQFPVLFDPQTAGGLLFSVAAPESLTMLKALHEQGYQSAAVIGRVEGFQDAQIIVE